PGEQVGKFGKALFQFTTQLDQVLWNYAADKTMARPFAAFHVLAGLEVGQLLAGSKHELLLAAQLTGQFRHTFDQPAQFARQRMLSKQFGEVLLYLAEPVSSRAQARKVGKMVNSLVGQMVTFVKYVDRLARVRQNRAAAQRQIGQHHVVVGDDHVDLGHAFAGLVETALLKIRAM